MKAVLVVVEKYYSRTCPRRREVVTIHATVWRTAMRAQATLGIDKRSPLALHPAGDGGMVGLPRWWGRFRLAQNVGKRALLTSRPSRQPCLPSQTGRALSSAAIIVLRSSPLALSSWRSPGKPCSGRSQCSASDSGHRPTLWYRNRRTDRAQYRQPGNLPRHIARQVQRASVLDDPTA